MGKKPFFPSFGNILDSLRFSFDAGGGFVIYPNQPNSNMSGRGCRKWTATRAGGRGASIGLGLLMVAANIGCVPSPGWDAKTPAFSGVVLRAGKPVEGATVVVSVRDAACSQPSAEVTTGASGDFEIPAVERFRLFKTLFGDPLYQWNLCVGEGESRQVAGHRGGSMFRAPDSVALRCDLAAPPNREQGGICVKEPEWR